MRVTCQKCSAAYAVDDKLVTPKGVRAQCPKCRHLQTVKNDSSALPPSPHSELGAAAVPQRPPPAPMAPVPSRAPAAQAKAGFDAFGDLGAPLAQTPEADFNFDFDSLGPPTGSHPSPLLPAAPAPASALDFDFNPPPPTALNPTTGAANREMLDFGEFDLSGGVSTSPGTQVGAGNRWAWRYRRQRPALRLRWPTPRRWRNAGRAARRSMTLSTKRSALAKNAALARATRPAAHQGQAR